MMRATEGKSSTFIILGSLFALALYLFQRHISTTQFCAGCDFDDQNALFRLFYRNDAASGYHSEPTFFSLMMILGLSVMGSGLIVRHKKRIQR